MKTELGLMLDASGQAVPLKYVKPYDKLRTFKAARIQKRWLKAQAMLMQVYAETAADIEAVEKAAADGRSGARGLGVKGNFQFQSFDGLIQVARSARYDLRFDERLRVAQGIIEEVIQEKLVNMDGDIKELIRAAFRPTSDGLLSQARVMGLFRIKMAHPRWQQAMDLIRESIEARRGKTLFSVRIKRTRESDWESLDLDISACEPEPATEKEVQS